MMSRAFPSTSPRIASTLSLACLALLSACGGSGGGADSGGASVANITASPVRFSQTMTVSVSGRGLGADVEMTVDGPCTGVTRLPGFNEESAQWTCVVSGLGELVPRVRSTATRRELGSVRVEAPVPRVSMTITDGTTPRIVLMELDAVAAPLAAANFLNYVNGTAAFYRNTLIHQAFPGVGIMGGSYNIPPTTPGVLALKPPTLTPVLPDAGNTLKNLRGTVALVRDGTGQTATTRYFINTVDNPQFDVGGAQAPLGRPVIGRVVEGLDGVESLAGVPTIYDLAQALDNVPVTTLTVVSISQVR